VLTVTAGLMASDENTSGEMCLQAWSRCAGLFDTPCQMDSPALVAPATIQRMGNHLLPLIISSASVEFVQLCCPGSLMNPRVDGKFGHWGEIVRK